MLDFMRFHQDHVAFGAGDTDLTGRVFHSLTVIKPWGFKHGGLFYLCECKCGGYAVVKDERLLSGSAHTCGCSKIDYCRKTIEVVKLRQRAVADAVGKVRVGGGGL